MYDFCHRKEVCFRDVFTPEQIVTFRLTSQKRFQSRKRLMQAVFVFSVSLIITGDSEENLNIKTQSKHTISAMALKPTTRQNGSKYE